MSAPPPRKSNFMASSKGAGGSSSNAPRPPIIKRASSTSRMLSIPLAGFRATPTVDVVVSPGVAVATGSEPPHNLSHVFLDPSSKAATTSAQPLVRKRKDHKEGERSASKKGRKEKEGSSSRFASKKGRKGKEGSSSWPLPNDIFSPEFNISDRTNFHMSSTHRSLIEGLSEPVLTNAMLEMSTRATSLAWYLREFADRRGAENIRAELLAEKKKKMERGLLQKNRALTDDLVKAKEKISELEMGIVFEHEEGFNKALRQASVQMGVKESFTLGFDIEKDLQHNVLPRNA
ncbi:hypothetical protein LR48_Vigan04g151000 [Vigna angularis]|uniref:Uncharacterized protein n=1 Tax=Phaseolus angularis TaxID=3914 RepID=A0A0L9UFF6_PHAAN|nr:hypothetical protein LR48_Vigan04g151000 [Vigna angularis]